jgi:hypothetical protein
MLKRLDEKIRSNKSPIRKVLANDNEVVRVSLKLYIEGCANFQLIDEVLLLGIYSFWFQSCAYMESNITFLH